MLFRSVSIAIIVEDTEPNDIYNRYYYDDYDYDDYDDDYDDWLDDWYDNYYHRDRIHDYKSF